MPSKRSSVTHRTAEIGLEFMGKSFDAIHRKWATFDAVPDEWVDEYLEEVGQ